jgi:hypothetical protein
MSNEAGTTITFDLSERKKNLKLVSASISRKIDTSATTFCVLELFYYPITRPSRQAHEILVEPFNHQIIKAIIGDGLCRLGVLWRGVSIGMISIR